MAGEAEALIELARGPYRLTKETAIEVAEKVWFRHFRPAEIAIAKEFIRSAVLEGTYYFDVYLLTEEALDWMRRQPEAMVRMAIPYAHRIDAVCIRREVIWLMEFKTRLKYSAIGQLSGYIDWFRRQYRYPQPVKGLAVFWYDRPELHETCRRLRISILQMKEGKPIWRWKA